MNEKFITIFTPTYNRCDKLQRLYKSIQSQNCNLLEWLIIDDGSTDDTQRYIEEIIQEHKVDIRYVKKENGGKHTAHNEALRRAKGKMFFCVDSDDLLSEGAIEKIFEFWNARNVSENCCGIVAKKRDINNNYIMDDLPEHAGEITLIEMDKKYKCRGDKCFIFITRIAKQYPFPEVEGEYFFTESYIYDKIGLKYKFLMMNSVLNDCEYLSDGYTAGILRIMLNNPIGYKYYYSQRIGMAVSLLERIKYIVSYNEFSFMSKTEAADYSGRFEIMVNLLRVTGPVMYLMHRLRESVLNRKVRRNLIE